MTDAVVHDVVDALDVLICGLDEAGTIHVFNRPCEHLTGIPRDAAIGQNWLDIFALGQRTDHVSSLWAGAKGNRSVGPFVALCRQGRSVRWQFSRAERERLPRVALWAVGIDVTHEREALVRAREAERMVALGNLVAGLTHELRNPLNGALLQLALAERNLQRRSDANLAPVTQATAQAAAEVRRISNILDDFLVFVRPQPIQLARTAVREVAARAIARARPRAEAAAVTVVLAPGRDLLAEIDAARVESAVFQLIANAIDAAAGASERIVDVTLATSGNSLRIEIRDGGAGFAVDDAPMFEPFFTTKNGGTGLGLAIVQRVAADHGGAIRHTRDEAKTTFILELPIVGGLAS